MPTTGLDPVVEARRLLDDAMLTEAGQLDPYPFLGRLHEFGEFALMEKFDVAFSYALCAEIMRSPKFGRKASDPSVGRTVFDRGLTSEQEEQLRVEGIQTPPQMPFVDGHPHARQRDVVSRAFTPRTVVAFRPVLEAYIENLVSGIEPGVIEFVGTVATPFPEYMISQLVGLPIADRVYIRELSEDWVQERQPGASFDVLLKSARAGRAMDEYMFGLIAERRGNPQPDLASALIEAAEVGSLSEPELVALMSLLYVSGYATTKKMLSNGLVALLENPEQMALLRENRDLLPLALNETLRVDPPVIVTPYFAKEDITVRGLEVAKGRGVLIMIGAANRDPKVYTSAEKFDVTREQSMPLMSFGVGPHHCLGASLARMEGEIVFNALLDRFSSIELAGSPERVKGFTFRGYRTLPVRVS
jgi:cytochrome P450